MKDLGKKIMSWTRNRAIAALMVLPFLFNSAAGFAQAAEAASAVSAFDQAVRGIRQEALKKGVSPATLNRALNGIKPIDGLKKLENHQPEHVKTFAQYYKSAVTQTRIDRGRVLMEEHAVELARVEQQYGIPAQYIVAIWAMETNYGDFAKGTHYIIPALATLARDGRNQKRRDYFRSEAIEALKILDQGYDEIIVYKGSWAGAFGHTQFMPSSFRRFAADGDGDGRKDIWTNLPDVFASTGNYLDKNGWKAGERWGREVKLPPGFSQALLTDKLAHQINKTPDEWAALGVKLPDGGALPADNTMRAMMIAPDGLGGPAFMVYNNFRTIMSYNSSYKYALAVAGLADALAPAAPRPVPISAPSPVNQ